MAVTIQPPEYISRYNFLLHYTSDLGGVPVFYVYVNGNLYQETTQQAIIIALPPGEALGMVVVDIFDDAALTPARTFTSRLTLNWAAVSGVDYYRIDQCVGGEWTQVGRVKNGGQPVFTWKSSYLSDVTNYVFRIMPVGTNKNEGTALALDCLMVRHPDNPYPTFVYSDGTHKVTVTI